MTHKEDNINNKYKQPINNNINKLILQLYDSTSHCLNNDT